MLIQCSSEKIEDPNNLESKNFKLELNYLKTTNFISKFLFNTGVVSLQIKKAENSIIIEPEVMKTFKLNGADINFSDYIFIIENNFLFFTENPEYKISSLNGIPYLVTPEYSGSIMDFDDIQFNSKTSLLIFMLNELTDISLERFDSKIQIESSITSKGCSFWDTYYVVNAGPSKSVSTENTLEEANEATSSGGELEGCTEIGSTDTSCLFAEHLCVTSQAYCCE